MTLILALMLEGLLGDPLHAMHPVALFGRWAAWVESRLYGDDRRSGVAAWLLVVGVPMLLLSAEHYLLGRPFDVLLLWISVAWRSLFGHVRAVLAAGNAEAARAAVAKIVSRDTAGMNLEDARRAALESLAENASDAVVAPLFWFVALGPLGAVLYRMVNTLDAMWGYRSARYRRFGWWAARVDDAANWLPARITARLMLCCGRRTAWAEVGRQAVTHASPNAGWPEAALAFAADVRLGGPVLRRGEVEARPFYGPEHARPVDAGAAIEAQRVAGRTLVLASLLALGVSLVI